MGFLDKITQDHPSKLLAKLRRERGMSMLHLADEAKVNPLLFDIVETSEDVGGYLGEETARRRRRRGARY